ncbi:MAG: ABC transporter ATP-binding protein [Bacteroidetes bacterium MedPE-SWsnd-G2]|nr:MAG: ABC transporter ATP-binding protein [Bacteroidetes bacterium MedPE-SWsnd-G2]
MKNQDPNILSISNLEISFNSNAGKVSIIKSISFDLFPNEILGIVGESGSGKSVSSLAIMGLLPKKTASIDAGSIQFEDKELTICTEAEFKTIRGKDIAMIFQEPMSALNPSMRCGQQVLEILLNHTSLSKQAAKDEVISLFNKVKLPNPDRIFSAYPHELSGGQKQRVVIAIAIACKPKILIADEPTTALDVTVQKEIIELLKQLQNEVGMSIIFISHDLSLVSEIADRVVVMYKGKIVETGHVESVFHNPQELYTKALINSRPELDVRLKQLPTIQDFMVGNVKKDLISSEQREALQKAIYNKPPLLEVKQIAKNYFISQSFLQKDKTFKALQNINFKLYEGETLGLVGESGCGKSTLANVILQLDQASGGEILYKGTDITKLSKSAIRALRKDIQIIFQDPYASLNPRLTVGQAIMEPMKVHNIGASKSDRSFKVKQLLEKVGLDEAAYDKYPHEFSGGQRQRIGIARTIALEPKLVICDESVSALDISVQAQVLNLLNDLKRDFNFTYIFISHDLAVVKYMADQLIVMNKGHIEEMGDADAIYKSPQKDYTKKLIHAIPKGL